jgi:hypothetical protein
MFDEKVVSTLEKESARSRYLKMAGERVGSDQLKGAIY